MVDRIDALLKDLTTATINLVLCDQNGIGNKAAIQQKYEEARISFSDEIQRLRAEVEELRATIAKPAIERAETRESLFPEMSSRIAAERMQARAEERERAAQIAEKQAAEYSGHARDLRYCDSDRRFYAACATRLRDLASLFRQAVKDGGAG